MDKISLDNIYRIIGELYLQNRIRVLELEDTNSSLSTQLQQLSSERSQLLAELGSLRQIHELPK